MASSSLKLIFLISLVSTLSLSVINACNARISDSSHGIVLPVVKDPFTRQYVAEIRLGDSPEPIKLVVDLGGPFLWFDCSSGHVSSSRPLIPRNSNDCAKASAHRLLAGDENDAACYLLLRNGVAGLTARGKLAQDIVAVGSGEAEIVAFQNLLFACAPQWLLQGLASGALGILGLGWAQISPPSQLAAKRGEQRRLTVYMSPSDGLVSSSSPEEIFGTGVSRSLVYTPLLTNAGGNYVINVKSIRINGEKLPINVSLSAELSTVAPYTMLESSIYAIFAEAFAKAVSDSTSARRVDAVAPFGRCFADTTAFAVVVDLALQSEMVKWRMEGRNLMVDVGGGVWCLGVIDGGWDRVGYGPIVMGGLQLEGFVLDFDLGNSVMGFGQRACSHEAL